MKQTQFNTYIQKLRSGGSIEFRPCDCAYFVSLFERYDENISFFVDIKDKVAVLSGKPPAQESMFFQKRAAERVKYYSGTGVDKEE